MSGKKHQTEAAATILECRRVLAANRGTLITEVTGGLEAADWQRFPEGEGYDPSSHAQFFYHRHPTPAAEAGARAEHGHFHLFLRAEGVPAGISPLVLPDLAVANAPLSPQSAPAKRGGRDEVCHLVAVALDRRGEPMRLFTTNRWVTGETWYRAEDVIAMLDAFRLEHSGGSALLNCWLNAIVRLFQREIAGLLRDRDAAIMAWRHRRRSNGFEDPKLEILSSVAVDLDDRLAGGPALHPVRRPLSRLPRMAEGWGL